MKGVIASINPASPGNRFEPWIPAAKYHGWCVNPAAFDPLFSGRNDSCCGRRPRCRQRRRPILIECGENYFIGPDNGVLSFAIESKHPSQITQLSNPYISPTTSTTFHGRDIFAPVAAHLSLGVPVDEFGESWRHSVDWWCQKSSGKSSRSMGRSSTSTALAICLQTFDQRDLTGLAEGSVRIILGATRNWRV